MLKGKPETGWLAGAAE